MPDSLSPEVIHNWVSFNPFATDRIIQGPSITVITTLQFFQLALVLDTLGPHSLSTLSINLLCCGCHIVLLCEIRSWHYRYTTTSIMSAATTTKLTDSKSISIESLTMSESGSEQSKAEKKR